MRTRLFLRTMLFFVTILLLVANPVMVIFADSPAQERAQIAYGQTVTGFIDDNSFFQQYSFEGAEGDAIVIAMDAISGNLDPLLLLGDVSLNLIAEDDDGGNEFNARLEIVLPADGIYVIEATRFGQEPPSGQSIGEYRLTLTANQVGGSGGVRRGGILSALDFGGTERGLLNADNVFHLFWFQAQPGDQIAIQSALGMGVSAALFLYDDTFTQLGSDPTGREVQAEIETGGIYFAALALTMPDVEGTYALTLSGSATVETAEDVVPVSMDYGQRIEGVITDQRSVEQYTFQGAVNDQVLIRMEALGSELDSFLYLYGPNGEIVGQDDDSGGGRNAELTAVLPMDGEYTVTATRFGRENGSTSGAYTLILNQGALSAEAESVAVLPQTDPESSQGLNTIPQNFVGLARIHYGDTVAGAIDDQNYFQFFVFEADAGDAVIVTMEQANGDLDPLVQLLDANIETIAQNDDLSPVNTNAYLEFTIPENGFYAIFATRYQVEEGTTTGDFVLTLNTPNATGESGVAELLSTAADPLTPDAPGSGQIGETPAALYTFYALADDVVELALSANDLLEPETVLILADGNLNEVAVNYANTLTHTIAQEGLYTIIVSRQGGPLGQAGGFFELSLLGVSDIAPTPPAAVETTESSASDTTPGLPSSNTLLPGQVVTGLITEEQTEFEYAFSGNTGDRITVRMDSLDATLDPLLIIRDAEGNEVVRDDDGGGNFNALIDSYLITATGPYTIVATRFQGRGAFELAFDGILVSQPETGPGGMLILAIGQTVGGTVNDETTAMFYSFQAEAGTTVQITMVNASGDLDPYLALLDDSQTLVAQDDDSGGNRNARLVYTVPASGIYHIVATRFELAEGTTSGEYLLSLTSGE